MEFFIFNMFNNYRNHLLAKESCEKRITQTIHISSNMFNPWTDPERRGRGSGPPPLKNHKNIGFLGNAGPDPLKNHKAIKPASNDGPMMARFQCYLEPISTHLLKQQQQQKQFVRGGPLLTKNSGSAHETSHEGFDHAIILLNRNAC